MNPTDPTPVVVVGAAGKMGRRLTAAMLEHPRLALAGATETPGHPQLGADAGTLAGLAPAGVALTSDLASLLTDRTVVVDFTVPEATMSHLDRCRQTGSALVIGTTGLTEDQKARVAEAGRKIRVVMAPNMSVGVNVLIYLLEQAVKIVGDDFDIEIVEAHHRLKKDAPSGTALRLLEVAAGARDWPLPESARYHREGIIGARPDREIGVQTVRAGDIVGDHTVYLAGPGERLELTHRAHSRDVFARGAARAAAWIANRPPGMYSMRDVLGLPQG